MRINHFIWPLLAVMLLTASCRSHYTLTGVNRTRILIDSRYDANPDQAAAVFIAPYKHQVDSIMGPVVGNVAHDMTAARPESDLSNLLSDILVWAAPQYGETPDLGIYNMGGIRAALTRGEVSYGDVLDVAPFENKISFITLSGESLTKLFQQIAKRGGEGVSSSVRMVITRDGQLRSVTVNGKPINPETQYRIATIDYLLGGNDGMSAFTEGTNAAAPKNSSNNTRFIIMNYFREQKAQGHIVDARVEGRIVVED